MSALSLASPALPLPCFSLLLPPVPLVPFLVHRLSTSHSPCFKPCYRHHIDHPPLLASATSAHHFDKTGCRMSNASQPRNGYLFVILSQPSPPSTEHILCHYSYIHVEGAVRQARLSSIALAHFGMMLHLTLPHNHRILLELMMIDCSSPAHWQTMLLHAMPASTCYIAS